MSQTTSGRNGFCSPKCLLAMGWALPREPRRRRFGKDGFPTAIELSWGVRTSPGAIDFFNDSGFSRENFLMGWHRFRIPPPQGLCAARPHLGRPDSGLIY